MDITTSNWQPENPYIIYCVQSVITFDSIATISYVYQGFACIDLTVNKTIHSFILILFGKMQINWRLEKQKLNFAISDLIIVHCAKRRTEIS